MSKKPTTPVVQKNKGKIRGEVPGARNLLVEDMLTRGWGSGTHRSRVLEEKRGEPPKHRKNLHREEYMMDPEIEALTSPTARFEEGKPADPTKNMSPEDAAEWKKQNEAHKDEFAKAARVLSKGDSMRRLNELRKKHGGWTKEYYAAALQEVKSGIIAPAAVVGGGYKDARAVALKWLTEQMQSAKTATTHLASAWFAKAASDTIEVEYKVQGMRDWKKVRIVRRLFDDWVDKMAKKPGFEINPDSIETHSEDYLRSLLASAWGPVLSRVADLADETCWEGYEAYGFKEKDGQSVPNCVPVKKASHPLDGVRGHQLWPATVARKVPALYSQEKVKDPTAWVKLFSPYSNAVWYITEYDPSSGEAFGWADLGMGGGELGYISIRELEGANKKGLPLVERDLYWKPMPLSRAKSSRTASEKKAATGGHHYVAPNGKVYVDTAFLNSIRGIPGTAVEHMGFGEFYADTPHGRVDFDRMRGVAFPGQSGRSHLLSGEGDSAKWLLQQMISKGHTEAASDDTRMASTEGRTARLMSRQEAILQKYLADAARSGIRAATGYDELPDGVRAALHRVKDQETLWSDVDRWFADNAPATRFRFAKFPKGVEMTVDEVAKVVGPKFKEMNENPPGEVVALREEMTGGKKASRDPLVAAWGNLMEKVGASGDTWGRQLGELQNDFINDVASALKETLEMEGFTVKSAQARGSTAAVVGSREGVPVSIALQWSGGGSVSIDSVMSLGDKNRKSNFPVISYTAENVASQALYKHFEGLLP